MIRNKFKYIIVSLIIGFIIGIPNHSYAAGEKCTTEQQDEISKNVDNNIKEAVNEFNSAGSELNNIISKIIKGCNTTVSGAASNSLTNGQKKILAELGVSVNEKNLLYLSASFPEFARAKDGRNATCNDFINKAQGAQTIAREKLARLANLIGIKEGRKESIVCVCHGVEGNQTGKSAESFDNASCMGVLDDMLEEKVENTCLTINEYQHELAGNSNNKDCLLCNIFYSILQADAKLADVAWNAVAAPLSEVVLIFFAVIIALETLKIVSNMVGSSINSYFKTILAQGLKVAIAYYALNNSGVIYGLFISPVILAGMDLAREFMQLATEGATAFQIGQSAGMFTGSTLDPKLLGSIYDSVINFNTTAAFLPAVGRALACHAWSEALWPSLSMWFSGIIYAVFGFFLWIIVAFFLIDCSVQLGMVCAFVPLFIACWPFKLTQRYSVTGARMIMNTFFTFVMLGVVMLVGESITTYALTGGDPAIGMEKILEMFNNYSDNIKDIEKAFSLDGKRFLILICCCYISFKIIGNATKLADMFSTSGGSSIGSKMGGLAGGLTTAGAKLGAKGAWKGSQAAARGGTNALLNNTKAGRAVAGEGRKVSNTAKNLKNRAGKNIRNFVNKMTGSGSTVTGSGIPSDNTGSEGEGSGNNSNDSGNTTEGGNNE